MSPSSITHRAILLILLAGLFPFGTQSRASSMSQCRFDPDGYFYVKGGSPRGFEKLDHIQMQVGKNGQRPTADSHLSTRNERSYRFARLGEFRTHSSGSGITFEFTTESVKGVHYQFSGKFTSICVLAESELDPDHVVAEGRLVKFEKGKEKRAADVELTYSNSPRHRYQLSPITLPNVRPVPVAKFWR